MRINENAPSGETTSYRGNAIVVGILFIVCSAASILSIVPLGSMLDGPDYLTQLAANGDSVVLASLIAFVWAATAAGIAIGLYPVLRKYNRSLALGSVVGRTVECMFVLVGTLSLLALLSLGQESAAAGQAAGEALLGVRDWALGFLALLSFGIGASMYSYLLYRSRLVPRWLSGWGLIGAGLLLVSTVIAGFAQEFGFTTVSMVLNIPIALQEMVLAVWLIAKGFSPRAIASARPIASGSAQQPLAGATT